MSGLVPPVATWNCQTSYKTKYAGLLVCHLQLLLNPWLIVGMLLAQVFFISIALFLKAQLVPLPFSQGRFTRYSGSLHDFSVTIPRC